MAESLTIKVVTPERTVVDGLPIKSLIVPSVGGYLGVLPDHAPMIASLRIGVVKYRENGEYKKMAVTGGFLEVADNRAVILADAAELAGNIDVLRARAAKERAEARLREKRSDIDFHRAHAALQRANTRLRIAEDRGEREH